MSNKNKNNPAADNSDLLGENQDQDGGGGSSSPAPAPPGPLASTPEGSPLVDGSEGPDKKTGPIESGGNDSKGVDPTVEETLSLNTDEDGTKMVEVSANIDMVCYGKPVKADETIALVQLAPGIELNFLVDAVRNGKVSVK